MSKTQHLLLIPHPQNFFLLYRESHAPKNLINSNTSGYTRYFHFIFINNFLDWTMQFFMDWNKQKFCVFSKERFVLPYYHFLESLKLNVAKIAYNGKNAFYKRVEVSTFQSHPRVEITKLIKSLHPREHTVPYRFLPTKLLILLKWHILFSRWG